MAARNELAIRARNVGLDPNTYTNDSKLEQKILWLEKRATTFAGTAATGVLTWDNVAQVADGDTATIGGVAYTFKTTLSAAAATTTLTSTGTIPADGDSVVVEGVQYTFRTALTNAGSVPYEVLINASAANALVNLKKAVNGSGVLGTDYGTGTIKHALVTAGAITSTTLVLTANVVGTQGNSYVTAIVTGATLSFTGTTLAGGAAYVPNQVKIAGTGDLTLTNLVSAINGAGTAGTDYDATTSANPYVSAGAVAAHATTVTAKNFAAGTNADVATTKSSTHLSWGGANLTGGVAKQIVVDATTANGSSGIAGDANV